MRLKLNRTLRAALIAAISTVGFTLSQAQAEETYTVTLPATGTAATFDQGHCSNNVGQLVSWAAGKNVGYYVGGNNNSYGNPGASGEGTYAMEDNVGSVILCGRSGVGGDSFVFVLQDQAMVGQTYDSLTFTVSGSMSNTLTMGGNFAVGVTGESLVSATGHLDNVKTSGSTSVTLTFANPFTFTESTKLIAAFRGDGGSATTAYTIQNIHITASVSTPIPPSEILTWMGTEQTHELTSTVWVDGSGATVEYSDAKPLVFGTDGHKTVTVSNPTTAKSMEIQADAYTFENSGTLTVQKLTVDADASLTIKGTGTLNASVISLAAGTAVTATEGAVINLDGAVSAGADAYVVINDTATGVITGASANVLEHVSGSGDIHIAGDTLFAGSSNQGTPATTHSTGTLFVDEGKTLSIGTKETGGYVHTYVDMTSFEKIQLDGSNLYIHNDEFTLRNLTVTAKGGKVTIHDTTGQNNNTLTLAGTTQLDGNLTFVGTWKQKFTIDALAGEGALILNGVDHDKQIVNIGGGSAGKLQIGRNNVEANITGDLTVGGLTGTEGTVNVSEGKKLTFNVAQDAAYTYSSTLNGANMIAKSGLGTQTIAALNVTTGNLEATEGVLVLGSLTKTGEGEYTMSGAGTVKLESAIALQGGTLTMSGTYDINELAVEGGTPSYEGGDNAGNGFATENGTIQAVTIAAESGATLNAASGTFVWNDKGWTINNETGKVAVSGTKYDVFYVNTLSEKVTKAMEHGQELTSIHVMEGATLTVDQAINASLIHASSVGSVSINAGQVVTADVQDRAVTLTGAGTYKLAENVASLGSATLGEGWTGAVEVSGTNLGGRDFTFNALANENSTVLMSKVAIWWNPDVVSQSANISLNDAWKDNGTATGNTAALQIKDASANRTYTFSGTISGGGDMAFTKTGALALTVRFTGDISEWTGKYASYVGDANTRSNLQFQTAGESTVNADIVNHGGLNVTFGGGDTTFITMSGDITSIAGGTLNLTVAKDTTFTGTVAASAITVNSGATATFGDLTLVSAISNSGTVAFTKDLEVSGDYFTEQQDEGIYDLEDHFHAAGTANGYLGNSDAYISLVNGGDVTGQIAVTMGDYEYALNGSGNAVRANSGAVTSYETFYVNTGSVNISAITNPNTTAIQVSSGTLNVDTEVSGIAITVTDSGTISGEAVNPTQVGIATDAQADFTKPVEVSGVKFTAAEGENVSVVNYGETAQYTTDNADMNVLAQTLEMTKNDGDVIVSNAVWVDEVVNITGHKLTLDNRDALVLESMTIGHGSTVEMLYTEQEVAAEGTVTITETLTAGGGTLLANLTVKGGSMLDMVGYEGNLPTLATLTLGSKLSFAEDGLVLLSDDVITLLNNMEVDDYWDIFQTYEDRQLEFVGDYDNAWFDALFNRNGVLVNVAGDFQIEATPEHFRLVKSSMVPEPTTGTLSLLALMALAARRRRK